MESLYKYCPIYDSKNFEKEYSIINLLNHQMTFSTRNNFNDLFDSKIDFIKPNKIDIRNAHSRLKGQTKHEFKDLFFGKSGENNFQIFHDSVNEIFDKYLILCLTECADNNLMWSHYANSHKGFCLELDATKLKAEKVIYQNDIASFELLDAIKMDFNLMKEGDVGIKIWNALKVKLEEWSYEKEHRVHLSRNSQHLVKESKEHFSLVEYQPDLIKSIIFGHRMDTKIINFLKGELPQHVQFKYAAEGRNKIIIKDHRSN